MSTREYIATQLDTMPENILEKIAEFIKNQQFSTVSSTSTTSKRKLGGMEGKIWMADDFNEPMEEFAEYM
jgi:hypothetical protein